MKSIKFHTLVAFVCALLVSPLFGQKEILVHCETPDSKIYDYDFLVVGDKLTATKVKDQIRFVKAKKEGFKTRIAFLEDGMSEIMIPALKVIPMGDSSLKDIRLLNVICNNKIGDVLGRSYSSPQMETKDLSNSTIETDYRYFLTSDNFGQIIDAGLRTFGYEYTKSSILSTNNTHIYVNAEIKEIVFNKTTLNKSEYGRIKLVIEWTFESPYTDVKKLFITTSSSDPLNIDRSRASFNALVSDAIEYSLIDLLENVEAIALLKINNELAKGNTNPKTEIRTSSKPSSSLDQSLQSIVKVNAKNNLFSSGTIISGDGYIISDYSVVSELDSSVIVKIDSISYPAKVIAHAQFFNVALLKIEANNLIAITYDDQVSVELTNKVYALSYSDIKLLSRYVTSGRVSGIRTFHNTGYYQTDLPLSGGNSGGLVLNEKLKCIGIINSKVNSIQVEGIGFVTPLKTVFEALNIQLLTD